MKLICAIVSLIGLALLTFAIGYCFLNDSGHGGDPRTWFSFWFLPVLLVGSLGYLFEAKPFSTFTVLVGAVGIPFGFFAHHTGILMEYELWIDAGMPDQNPFRMLLLSGYVVASAMVLVIGTKRAMPNKANTADAKSRAAD